MSCSNHCSREGYAVTVLLIADDDPDVRWALERTFVRAGFTVLTAADGIAALRIAVSERPDVVLTDMDMPRLTGLELCQAIRGHHEIADMPVAILSGRLMPGDTEVAAAGLCATMLKPFTNSELVSTVRMLADAGRHPHGPNDPSCTSTATRS